MPSRSAIFYLFSGTCLLVLSGCGAKTDKEGEAALKGSSGPPKVELKPEGTAIPVKKGDAASPVKTMSFEESVRLEPPDGEMRPPDVTAGGKNIPKMYMAIAAKGGLWDSVAFRTSEGKKIRYTADVKTDLGTIQIELLSDDAPNHVRNFIALAKAGYYDGLCFHRSLRQESMGKLLAYVEAGCPKGTGEVGYGSVGYWLKPEINVKHLHEEGTVGAWHAEELETAACRFYVTLCKAPWMDGNYSVFGKIVAGLDVARTINSRPIHDDEFKDRPVEPVIIREVAIHSKVMD